MFLPIKKDLNMAKRSPIVAHWTVRNGFWGSKSEVEGDSWALAAFDFMPHWVLKQERKALFLCLGFKWLQDFNSTAHASICACHPHCKDPRTMQIFCTEQKRGPIHNARTDNLYLVVWIGGRI